MRAFLVFQLAAPIAAFGDIAVGERRGTWDRPAKSAVLGLVAAALGIERPDGAAHAALAAGYHMAVRGDAPGRVMADYHTAQIPSGPAIRRLRKSGRVVATRADELAADDIGTTLSRRDYRVGVLHLVALAEADACPWPLAALDAALRQPVFTLYAGRKSCPLALPLAPRIVMAADAPAAFRAYDASDPAPALRDAWRARHQPPALSIASDPAIAPTDAPTGEAVGRRVEHRRDLPLDRRRWQFGLREEHVTTQSTEAIP